MGNSSGLLEINPLALRFARRAPAFRSFRYASVAPVGLYKKDSFVIAAY